MGEKQKCRHLKQKDLRKPQDYMHQKSLADSRLEFLWQTDMIETRATQLCVRGHLATKTSIPMWNF